MGFTDKAKDKMQAARGRAKEEVGEVADDPALRAEGAIDRVAGNLKQAGEKVRDAFKEHRSET